MDAMLDMPVHTAILRAVVLSYYMVFGSLWDVVLLTSWLLWVRGDLVFELFETLNSHFFVRGATVAIAAFSSFKCVRNRSRAVEPPAWDGPSGRHADKTESQLEPLFRRYLKHLVEQSPGPLVVRYIPSGIAGAQAETMKSSQARKAPNTAAEMDFKVLTPAFYSRFVYYAHDFEAIFCELNENNTIWVSKPELLPKLVIKKQPPPLLQTTSYLDYGYFMAIKNMRQRPERIERPLTSSRAGTATHSQKDIRGFRLSAMDGYVLAHEDKKARHVYRSSVLKLFVADRIAMGSVDILQLEHLVLKLLLAWIAMF
ncbi:hypothetical protein F4821DRAFT_45771 [Hypoxylon rubiginosum]|uniref:Uncharacterized protein n=1 Tax=Hypoxylon rubiginosum TaxID=110542 RepID=A0ACC0DBU6_9PEZI|nr:hypothetical protein F4821DRAFT_45771 [Hypoxylon rubiginosum]